MVWLVDKKVFHYILDLGYEGVAIPIRVKFEFEVRQGAFVPHSLSFENLFNRKAVRKRYPNVKLGQLEEDINNMVKMRLHRYFIESGYLKASSDINEIT